MKKNIFWRIVVPVCLVLWTVFIWSRSLKSAAASSADSRALAAWLAALFGDGGIPKGLNHILRKCAHFAEFGVLGTLWGVCGRLYPLRWVWLYGTAVGAVDECLQFFAPGRGPMVTDVLLDTAGYLCGLLFVMAVAWLCKKKGATA